MVRSFAVRTLAVGGGAVLAGSAAAQQPTTLPAPVPFQMPGTPVGQPLVQPVGGKIPQAVPPAGAPVGTGPGGVPDPLNPGGPKPPGEQINMDNVIAPYPGMPDPEPNFWEKLEKRWMSLFQSDTPAVRPTQWTPGIGRRNRERREAREMMMWRRS